MEANTFIVLLLTGSLFAPAITALINRPTFTRGQRMGVAFAVSIVVSVVAILGTGGFTGQWYQDMILVLTVSTFAYETLWKSTGASVALENATSPKETTR